MIVDGEHSLPVEVSLGGSLPDDDLSVDDVALLVAVASLFKLSAGVTLCSEPSSDVVVCSELSVSAGAGRAGSG
jgi:hypothetical protein